LDLSSTFRSGVGGVDVKSCNEVIDVVGSADGIVKGDIDNTLSIKRDVGNGCPSVLCTKDIVSDSDEAELSQTSIIGASDQGESLIC